MSQDIQGTIQYYIQLEHGLLTQLNQLKRQKTDIGAEIGKTILGEVGAAIAGEVFESPLAERYGRKMTKSYLTQQQKVQLSSQEKTISDQHDWNVRNVRSFLSTISEKKPNLKEPNSHILTSRIDRAQEYVRLESRIRRTVTALQSIANKHLIFNKDIPKLIEERRRQRKEVGIEPHNILRDLETKLRQGIQVRLRSVSSNWWTERIPVDVKKKAEERKTRDEKPWPWYERRELTPIFYIDFADYAKIIRRKDNWEQVFKSIFKDEEIISSKLRELEPIRNAIAHNRELTPIEKERLRLLATDITSCFEE